MQTNSDYQNHADFLTRGPYASYVTEVSSTGARPVRIFSTSQPAGDFSDPEQPDILLYQVVKSEGVTTRDHGSGRLEYAFSGGEFDLQAPDVANHILTRGRATVVDYVLPMQSAREILEPVMPGFSGDFGALHARPFKDSVLHSLCRLMFTEAQTGNQNGDLFAEGLFRSIVSRLLSLQKPATYQLLFPGGNFSAKAMKRLDEFVRENLHRRLASKELSDLFGMPETVFATTLKRTTGMSPYKYVMSLRMQLAQDILSSTDLPLTTVAFECGFSSQSHMNDQFRAKLDTTPGAFRRNFL